MVPAGRADIEFHAACSSTAEGRTRRPPEAVEGAKDAHGTVGHRFRGETISTHNGSTAAMAGRSTPAPRRPPACLPPFGTADAAGQVFEWRGKGRLPVGCRSRAVPGTMGSARSACRRRNTAGGRPETRTGRLPVRAGGSKHGRAGPSAVTVARQSGYPDQSEPVEIPFPHTFFRRWGRF